jgi:gas vesicle protein
MLKSILIGALIGALIVAGLSLILFAGMGLFTWGILGFAAWAYLPLPISLGIGGVIGAIIGFMAALSDRDQRSDKA